MLLLGALLASGALAVPAGAQTSPAEQRQRANELFRRGSTLFSGGDFQGALELLRAAYLIYPSDKIGLSMGYAFERLGRLPEAAGAFARFLQSPLGKADRARAVEVEGKLARLRASLGRISLSCAARGATVEIDGGPVGVVPLAHEIYVSAGPHWLTVTQHGRVLHRQQVRLQAGEHHWALVEAPPAPPTASAAAPHVPVYKRWWFWVVVGSAVTAGVVAAAVIPNVGGSDWPPRQELGIINMRPAP